VVLESLLTDTCAFFDSLCQDFIREKSRAKYTFKQQHKVGNFQKKADGSEELYFNCGDYRLLLEGNFGLSTRRVNLNPYEDALYSNPMNYAPDEISGYMIVPFKEWSAGTSPTWWEAFTSLKHDRMSNFQQATLENALYSLAAVFIMLTVRNEADFKAGKVSPELYNLFFPKYWTFKGRVHLANFTWS
jgi:hypothetical protein